MNCFLSQCGEQKEWLKGHNCNDSVIAPTATKTFVPTSKTFFLKAIVVSGNGQWWPGDERHKICSSDGPLINYSQLLYWNRPSDMTGCYFLRVAELEDGNTFNLKRSYGLGIYIFISIMFSSNILSKVGAGFIAHFLADTELASL